MVGDSRSFWDDSPEDIVAHAHRLYQNGRWDDADAAYTRALRLDPVNERARVGLASIAAARGDHARAYELYLDAEKSGVVRDADLRREMRVWLGVTSRRFGRHDESLKHLNAAVEAAPRHREVRYHAAMTSLMLGKVDVAVSHMRHIDPPSSFVDADFQLLKTLLAGVGEWAVLAAALELCRSSACSFAAADVFTRTELLVWLATSRRKMGDADESDRLLAEATSAESSSGAKATVAEYAAKFDDETRRNQAVMKRTASVDKEITLLGKALSAAGTPSIVQSAKQAMERCDWDAVDSSASDVVSAVRDDPGILQPFTCLTLPHFDAADCLEVARSYTRKQMEDESKVEPFPPPPEFSCDGNNGNRGRGNDTAPPLVVGVFSADFRPHPMAPLLNAFFAHARKGNLEVIFFHKQAAPNYLEELLRSSSEEEEKGGGAVRELVDVTEMRPRDIAAAARQRGVQVWLETTGYTGSPHHSRHLFHRPAPIAVAWAGFPGGLGAPDFVQYVVADEYSLPSSSSSAADRGAYDERPLRVPGSWLIADPEAYASVEQQTDEDRAALRATLLNVTDSSTAVYAYLGRLWKVSRDDMDRWCRIARAVPGSVFWMALMNSGGGSDNTDPPSLAADNIRRHWGGICRLDDRRLVFSQPFQRGEHLGAWRAADVALGTSAYNSGATALDALFSGVPLVHIAGGSKMMQRAEGSLLRGAGLEDELIAASSFEYVQIAARLGTDESFRARIAGRIERLRNESEASRLSPEANVVAMGRGMREAYRRYCDGEAPSEIPVDFPEKATADFSSPSRAHSIDGENRSDPYIVGLAGFIIGLLLGWLCFYAYSRKSPTKEATKQSAKKVARRKAKVP